MLKARTTAVETCSQEEVLKMAFCETFLALTEKIHDEHYQLFNSKILYARVSHRYHLI